MNAVVSPDAYSIRLMQEDDIPAVIEVEELCYDFPWSATIFADCLRVGYCCWVLDSASGLAGHGIMSVAVEESHILNICVAPQARRQGHARAMMRHLMTTASRHGARITYLEVRPSNSGAIELYNDLGFRHVGTRKGYYPAHEGREDALVLSTPLGPRVTRRERS